jgi:hypothetical protein
VSFVIAPYVTRRGGIFESCIEQNHLAGPSEKEEGEGRAARLLPTLLNDSGRYRHVAGECRHLRQHNREQSHRSGGLARWAGDTWPFARALRSARQGAHGRGQTLLATMTAQSARTFTPTVSRTPHRPLHAAGHNPCRARWTFALLCWSAGVPVRGVRLNWFRTVGRGELKTDDGADGRARPGVPGCHRRRTSDLLGRVPERVERDQGRDGLRAGPRHGAPPPLAITGGTRRRSG